MNGRLSSHAINWPRFISQGEQLIYVSANGVTCKYSFQHVFTRYPGNRPVSRNTPLPERMEHRAAQNHSLIAMVVKTNTHSKECCTSKFIVCNQFDRQLAKRNAEFYRSFYRSFSFYDDVKGILKFKITYFKNQSTLYPVSQNMVHQKCSSRFCILNH